MTFVHPWARRTKAIEGDCFFIFHNIQRFHKGGDYFPQVMRDDVIINDVSSVQNILNIVRAQSKYDGASG